jgi:deoxycytidine triphosphate deaminase
MAVWLGKNVAKYISNHAPIKINPNGVDVRVSEVWKIHPDSEVIIKGSERTISPEKAKILFDESGFYNLDTGIYEIRLANEVEIPQEATALMFPRSTLNRLGMIKSETAVGDSGYKGFMTQTFYVPIKKIRIHKDEAWVQLIFIDNKDVADMKYEGHWQGEKPK